MWNIPTESTVCMKVEQLSSRLNVGVNVVIVTRVHKTAGRKQLNWFLGGEAPRRIGVKRADVRLSLRRLGSDL